MADRVGAAFAAVLLRERCEPEVTSMPTWLLVLIVVLLVLAVFGGFGYSRR